MIVFQVVLLASGLPGGWLLAYRLRRLPWDRAARRRAAMASGAGVIAWVFFAMVSLPGPVGWTFVGAMLALYLPSLLVLLAPGGRAGRGGRVAGGAAPSDHGGA